MRVRKKDVVAMLLAGGQGSRLGILTQRLAKPAVPFGGKYRIIDFTLSNCTNSGIDTVGVLTQYQPLTLNRYIGQGSAWDLDRRNGGVSVLPPYVKAQGGEWYKGTANAVYQNIEFIESFEPQYVLVLSGDHIYKMDYSAMIEYHKAKGAAATIAVFEVPWEETSRFGIMNTNTQGEILEFQEKPKEAKNNLASMGVYVFDWPVLKRALLEDEADPESSNDFGKNIVPKLLEEEAKLYAYPFQGYWKDVGTIYSLWEANMDLLKDHPELDLYDSSWKIYTPNPSQPAQFVAKDASVNRSLVNEGCMVHGDVEHSVLFPGVYVGRGAVVRDSVIMPGCRVEEGAIVERAIIGEDTVIGRESHVGAEDGEEWNAVDHDKDGITVLAENLRVPAALKIKKGSVVSSRAHQEFPEEKIS